MGCEGRRNRESWDWGDEKVNASTEYMVAALLTILLVFTAVSTFIPNALTRSTYISESQLRIEAEKIVNQLLLNPGDPPNWGVSTTNSSEVKVLGLALQGGRPYELDINKIIRMYENILNEFSDKEQMDFESVCRLLGLYGNYSLSIKLTPVLNITVQKLSSNIYEVTVKTHDNLPVTNAVVNAVRITAYMNCCHNMVTYIEDPIYPTYTDHNGKATLEFTQQSGELSSVVVVYVDFYGVKTVFSYVEGSSTYGVIIGNDLYVGHIDDDFNPENMTTRKGRPRNPGGGAIHLSPAALIVTPTGLEPTMLYEGRLLPITPEGGARPYYKFELEGLEDDAVMVLFVIKNRGEYKLVVAQRAYNNLDLGMPTPTSGLVARGVHIRRTVTISGFLYYFDLTLWRVVEDG